MSARTRRRITLFLLIVVIGSWAFPLYLSPETHSFVKLNVAGIAVIIGLITIVLELISSKVRDAKQRDGKDATRDR